MRTLLLASALGGLCAAGCVTTSAEGAQMRADIDVLKEEVADLDKQMQDQREDVRRFLDDAEARVVHLEETLNALRQADADSGVQMEKVIAEVQILRGEIEEARHQLGETKKSVQDILERPPVAVAAAETAPKVEDDKKLTIAGQEVPEDKQALYDFGKKLFDEKKYADSVRAFELFVQRHKDDVELVDNAWFWKGEAHYADAGALKDKKAQENAYKQAILAYQKVLELPKANKKDGALFKIGLAFEALGYHSEAKVFYEEILAKHKKSPLVGEAKKRLKVVKKKARKR
jgi:TolA-binding protein